MELSNHTWSERYVTADTGWDIGEASVPLRRYIDGCKQTTCHVLVPGGGNGYEAEYLHQQGFTNVHLLDWAKEPLENFHKRVPTFPVENLLEKDFFEHDGKYDLILEQTFFCAIHPSLRAAYAQQVHKLLNIGGSLVGLLFNTPFDKSGPPFGGSREEYITYFEPLFRIHKMEPCYNSIKPRAGRELFINLIKEQ